MRTMMDFEFDTKKVQNTHFHQDLEILYVLDGGLEIQIESEKYELGKGDFLLINANKRHSIRETEEELLTASFRINFSMLAEYLGTNQILFWCNTTADKNEAGSCLCWRRVAYIFREKHLHFPRPLPQDVTKPPPRPMPQHRQTL